MSTARLTALKKGAAVPGVVTRTPYDKELSGAGLVAVMPNALKMAERGYAVLVCDTRGRYASEGDFNPFHQEGPDGYDTIEWLAAQPWCDGTTAIYGPSYVGATTMLGAREAPPSLRCAIPIITADDYYDGWTYQGGAFQLGFVGLWGAGLAATGYLQHEHEHPSGCDAGPAGRTAGRRVPLPRQPTADGAAGPLGARRRRLVGRLDRPQHARRLLGGCAALGGLLAVHRADAAYRRVVRHLRDRDGAQLPGAHGTAGVGPQHMIIGPWAHTNYDRWLGELDFGATGAAAAANVVGDINRFLDRHLKGRDTGLPEVRWFLMGANEWRTSTSWPPPEAEARSFYLGSNGGGTLHYGDGRLDDECPAEDDRWDSYLYIAHKPVITNGGSILQIAIGTPGPRDQSRAESRDDVLCYSTEPLQRPLDVAGPVSC